MRLHGEVMRRKEREPRYSRPTGPLFGPHEVLERSDTCLYVPVHGRSDARDSTGHAVTLLRCYAVTLLRCYADDHMVNRIDKLLPWGYAELSA